MYTLGFIITTVVAWVLSGWGDQIPGVSGRITAECDESCWRYVAVDRVSLGFIIYHSFLCLLMIGVGNSRDPRAFVHNGMWPIKALVWFGCIIGMFFVEPYKFSTYWIATFVFASIFILIQAMLLVDFAWAWASSWVEKMESENEEFYKALLLCTTVIFYIFFLVFTIILFVYFASKQSCGLNAFFISFNIILVLIMSVVSILPQVQEANHKSGIFQAAIMSFYTTYLVGSAIGNQPNVPGFSCSPLAVGEQDNTLARVMLVFGVAMTFLALAYQAFAAGSSSGAFITDETGDDEEEHTVYNYSWFHFMFVLAMMYSTCLYYLINCVNNGVATAVLTNWATFGDYGGDVLKVDYGITAMWIKVATSWLSGILYIWTLIAPVLLLEHIRSHMPVARTPGPRLQLSSNIIDECFLSLFSRRLSVWLL